MSLKKEILTCFNPYILNFVFVSEYYWIEILERFLIQLLSIEMTLYGDATNSSIQKLGCELLIIFYGANSSRPLRICLSPKILWVL